MSSHLFLLLLVSLNYIFFIELMQFDYEPLLNNYNKQKD